jgi:hypothetical protein
MYTLLRKEYNRENERLDICCTGGYMGQAAFYNGTSSSLVENFQTQFG